MTQSIWLCVIFTSKKTLRACGAATEPQPYTMWSEEWLADRLTALTARVKELELAVEITLPLVDHFCKVSGFFSSEDAAGNPGPMPKEVTNGWTIARDRLRAALTPSEDA